MRTIHYPRRRRVQILSPLMRETRLLKSGNKWSDIKASTRAASKLRKQRKRSSNRKGTIFGLFKPASWEDFINTDKDAFRNPLLEQFMILWGTEAENAFFVAHTSNMELIRKVFGWRLDTVQTPESYAISGKPLFAQLSTCTLEGLVIYITPTALLILGNAKVEIIWYYPYKRMDTFWLTAHRVHSILCIEA